MMSDAVSFKLLSSLTDFAVRIDADDVIRHALESSQVFLELPANPIGESVKFLIQPEDMETFLKAKNQASLTGEKQTFVCRLLRQHVLPVWVDCHIFPLEDQNEHFLVAFDASHWKENEAKLFHLSTHDHLTGLPSRVLLDDRLTVGINTAQREQKGLVLLLLNLDGFRKVNDSLGHTTGDMLIKALVERLKTVIRSSDTLARIGGDEFAMIMMGSSQLKDAEFLARKIMATVQRPFQIENHNLYISASLGVATYPEHGDNTSTLLGRAEMAMHSAKALGKSHWKIYNQQIDGNAKDELSLEADMHEGIRNGEFLLHYQPIFCVKTGKLKGAEALMRWDRPGKGLISPGKFIPLAESSGLIEMLGAWALRIACRQAKLWQEAGIPDFYVSVNASPRQFMQEGFPELIDKAISESGLPPSSLMLEITEGVLMNNPERSNALLVKLRASGVKIAIDDFGTGYSSLAYLKKFPLSVLKIDKSFINDVVKHTEDMAIVSAVLSLAEGLGLTVVAEGVEHQEQLDFLKSKGCNLVQGYLTGKPMHVDVFQEKFLS